MQRLLMLTVLCLGACAPLQAEINPLVTPEHERHDQVCQEWGLTAGTDAYRECRRFLYAQARQPKSAGVDADTLLGLQLLQNGGHLTAPPKPCITQPFGTGWTTTCY